MKKQTMTFLLWAAAGIFTYQVLDRTGYLKKLKTQLRINPGNKNNNNNNGNPKNSAGRIIGGVHSVFSAGAEPYSVERMTPFSLGIESQNPQPEYTPRRAQFQTTNDLNTLPSLSLRSITKRAG